MPKQYKPKPIKFPLPQLFIEVAAEGIRYQRYIGV